MVVCGDMNSQPGSLVDQYLVNGVLSEDQHCEVVPRVEYDNKKHVDEVTFCIFLSHLETT